MLYPLAQFGHFDRMPASTVPAYWYEGVCPHKGELLRLPRTGLAEAIAGKLIQQLQRDRAADHEGKDREGKMYGILLVETPDRELGVLKAFSGLLAGQPVVAGWVPPISGRDRGVFAEAQTLAELDTIKQELLRCQPAARRQAYQDLRQTLEAPRQALAATHAQRKQHRQQQRQAALETLTGDDLAAALARLNHASQQDGIERKGQKRDRDRQLQPLKHQIDQAEQHIQTLKHRRKHLSQRLQIQMHATYSLTNFAGESRSLQQVRGGSLPTGSGECCAPKLLHYAATHQLQPVAMAEFWWGPPTPNGDRVSGEFYGACAERCQPLMGFLLSGLSSGDRRPEELTRPDGSRRVRADDFSILYSDDWLIAVNKPPGLLSVPGRTRDRQDSVLTRLQAQFPNGAAIAPVHRLDQDTSGILLFARDAASHRHLSQQFQQRQVHKVYEAILAGDSIPTHGVIDLPLWGDPQNRPYQTVDWHRGKPSITQFRMMAQAAGGARLEFIPRTGRTHQLRVHAADSHGLGIPILGDRLYGSALTDQRLHLHAKLLQVQHPQSGQPLTLHAETPF